MRLDFEEQRQALASIHEEKAAEWEKTVQELEDKVRQLEAASKEVDVEKCFENLQFILNEARRGGQHCLGFYD